MKDLYKKIKRIYKMSGSNKFQRHHYPIRGKHTIGVRSIGCGYEQGALFVTKNKKHLNWFNKL